MKKTVTYEESFGTPKFPEGFKESLAGLSIEEQITRYRVTVEVSKKNTGWTERTNSFGYFETEKISEVAGYIVQDNIVVGVMIKDFRNKEVPCFPEECVCYDYDSENNGAGYKTRESYVYLVCVPENF